MTRFIRTMSGCFWLRRSSICASSVRAASRRCAGVASAGSLDAPSPPAGAGEARGRRRRVVGGVAKQALEHQLAIPVPGQRLHHRLERHLGVLDRLHVGLRLRGQAAGVQLAEPLELLLLRFEPAAGVGQLRLEERAGLVGLRSALLGVPVDEEAGQLRDHVARDLRVVVVERDPERVHRGGAGVASRPLERRRR